jgi:Niemann-Pick C1 protein
VFVVSLVLIQDVWIAFLIVGTVTMIEVDLFGIMKLWNISLNAVSVTNLVMAIGICAPPLLHLKASRF